MAAIFRKTGIIFCLGMLCFFSACSSDDDNNSSENYEVTVIGKGVDCGDSFLLKFKDNASGLPKTIGHIYYEINLPKKFKVEGKKLKINVRKPKKSEYFPCTTLGPGYRLLYIRSAEPM